MARLVIAECKVKHKHSVKKAHCNWSISLASQPPSKLMQKARSSKKGLVKYIYSPHIVLRTPIIHASSQDTRNIPSTAYWENLAKLPNKRLPTLNFDSCLGLAPPPYT